MDAPYWPEPTVPFDERRRLYLEYCAAQSPGGRTGFFSQIARLELGRQPVDEAPVREALAVIDRREDCSDFSVAGLLRILYKYRESPLISRRLINDIEACLLRFKYWWDERGDDYMCFFTENHQIIYHSDELLVGQMYRKQTFSNTGGNGEAHIAHALPFIYRWVRWRTLFGFSEWLSNCYIDEDLVALANLYDFAEDPTIRRWAGQFIDMLLFEMALHSHHGVMGCTHGRTYAPMIKGGRHEGTGSTGALELGLGMFNDPSSLSAVSLATSSYRCPPAIAAVAADTGRTLLIHERHSLDVEDTPRYGFRFDSLTDGLYYWCIQTYYHPDVVALSKRMSDLYHSRRPVFEGHVYDDYMARFEREKARFGRVLDADVDKTAMTAVNIETMRTPDYMLSCAQDYRPGKPGYQQHPWQATLGLDAVVFTNHPGALDESGASRPNFWAGDAILPRVAQHGNVLICVHHVPTTNSFPYSHAYLPRSAFDEVVQSDHWLCGRRGDGYIGLYSQHPTRRPVAGPHQDTEVRVDAPDNVWVCEMGRQAEWGSFASFVKGVTGGLVACEGLQARYWSPSQGLVEFGWQGPLRVNTEIIPLRGYKRFDNPYCQAELMAPRMTIRCGGQSHEIDLSDAIVVRE
jgi:hypothetical protein